MRAIAFDGSTMEIADVKPSSAGPEDVVIRMRAAGLCHSDLGVVNGEIPHDLPVILGHEGVGEVVWVGRHVTRVKPGDRVIPVPTPECGVCASCRRGQTTLCERQYDSPPVRAQRSSGALCALWHIGAFAEQVTTREANVIPIRSSLSDAELALLGCGVTTGLGAALNAGAIQPGDTTVVIGCGGVGLAAVQGACLADAGRIIALDPVPERRELAIELGATDALTGESAADEVLAATNGAGADQVLDCVAQPGTVADAVRMTRLGGSVVIVGCPPQGSRLEIDLWPFFESEVRLRSSLFGSVRQSRDIQRFAEAAEAGRLKLGRMLSVVRPLEEIDEAMNDLRSHTGIRTVLTFDG